MVEIAEAHLDRDHNCFLELKYVHFYYVYVHQPKLHCFAKNPKKKKTYCPFAHWYVEKH